MKKVGVFGGTFDPFTKAHIEIVNKALDIVDEVVIIPTTITYYRESNVPPLFSFEQRMSIIQECCKEWEDCVYVSGIEYGRPDTWRFVDTLEKFKEFWAKNGEEIYIIVGSDTFDKLETWASYEYIIANYKFIVAEGRDGKHSVNTLPHETIEMQNNWCSASFTRKKLVEILKNEYLTWLEL